MASGFSEPHNWVKNNPKKQHFVPQFLLKNFSTNKGLWVFDKKSGKSFLSSPINTGHENYFYRGENLDGDSIDFEDVIQRFDGYGSEAVRLIIQHERLTMSEEYLAKLAFFTALQIQRGPSVRSELEVIRKSIIAKGGDKISYEGDSRSISSYGPKDSKYVSILGLRDVPDFANILQRKLLLLLKAPEGTSFLCSDNPVVRHNEIDYSPRGSLGIAQLGIELYFPISPTFALQYCCPLLAPFMENIPSWRKVTALEREGHPILMEREHVIFMNHLQVTQSERFLYANRRSSLALAEEMIRDHPEIKRPASEKIIAS